MTHPRCLAQQWCVYEKTRHHHRHNPGGLGLGGRGVFLAKFMGGQARDPAAAPGHRQAFG